MAISRRTSDVVYSRANSSILSITGSSAPSPETIQPADLFVAFEDYFDLGTSSNSGPLDTNTTTAALMLFLSSYFVTASETPSGVLATSYLRSLLALPLLLFQASWFNLNLKSSPDQPATGLPSELYVSADLARFGTRAYIPPWTVILYIIISLSAYIWAVGGLVFSALVQWPPASPFELIDFVSRVITKSSNNSLATTLAEIADTKTDELREKLEDKTIFVGPVEIGERSDQEMTRMENFRISQRIGFTSNSET